MWGSAFFAVCITQSSLTCQFEHSGKVRSGLIGKYSICGQHAVSFFVNSSAQHRGNVYIYSLHGARHKLLAMVRGDSVELLDAME